MSKVAKIKELVEWTTGNDSSNNYCIGIFSDDADKPFILKEIKNAPVERETMKSRVYLNKHRDEKSFFSPTSLGYAEAFIKIYTNKILDDYDFRDAKINYAFASSGKEKVNGSEKNFYIFEAEEQREEI